MIKKWLAAVEIAQLINRTDRAIRWRAEKEHWTSRNEKTNGGERRSYQVSSLPEDVQAAYAASIKTTLEGLQNLLKPASEYQKKVNIPR
jgi:hypothetical protein